jgi:hypothetical protein
MRHWRWLIRPESLLVYMWSCLEDEDMQLETAERQHVPCEDIIELALQLVLQGRPGGCLLVIFVDDELQQQSCMGDKVLDCACGVWDACRRAALTTTSESSA